MTELIVRELRLRSFNHLALTAPQYRHAAVCDSAAVIDSTVAEERVRRLAERHSRQRRYPNDLAV